MPRIPNVAALVLAICVLASSGLACAQSSGETDLDRERLIENLKLQIPQLRQAQSITVGPVTSSEVPGFRQTTLTINNRNQVPALVRDDGQQLLLLAAPPVDASRSIAEVQAEMDAEAEEREATLSEAAGAMPVRGAADAPVTMIAFSDFQCPYCKQSTSLIDAVLDAYPEQVNFVFLHFPLPNHGWAKPASIAAQCAARQSDDAFWTLHDAYFANQGQITEANVIDQAEGFLQGADLDMAQWRTCATDEASGAHQTARQVVEQALRTGEQLGVRGTPTFFIDGELMQGPRSVESFGARIEAAASE
ncbi:MAG: thioredoxin domain-containing protein [Bacteroidetes bacterium]|jgi:protein-disulfide isomerase|nr:thioredoxin domain-containing protein [Bacteroidota bacterium]